MPKLSSDQLKRILDNYAAEQTYRGTAESHWQEIADLMLPVPGYFIADRVEGEKVMSKVYNSYPMIANQLLSSAEFSMLTSPSNVWFKLVHPDPDIHRRRDVALWFEYTTKVMFNEIHRPGTGFTSAMHECYLEYNTFGNMTLFCDESEDLSMLRFSSLPLAKTYYIANEAGDIVGLYRTYNRRLIHLKERFGLANLSTEVQKKYIEGKYDEMINGVHVIMPRKIYDRDVPSSINLPYASYWIDTDHKHVMKEAGYHEQPFYAAAFYKSAMEKYGRGPGSIALPAAKLLMRAEQATIRGAQKIVDPPLQVPDKGFFGPAKTYAGGVNYYRRGSKDRIEPVKGGNPAFGVEYAQYIKDDIKAAFYINHIQLREGPQKTATEVIQETENDLRLMGPWLGRVMTFLGGMLSRVYHINRRNGKIPPPPADVRGIPMKTIFTSPIARAQEQIEANGLMRALDVVTPIFDRKPETADVLNEDNTIRGIWEMFNVSPRFLNDDRKVRQIRESRAAAEKERRDAENLRASGQGIQGLAQGAEKIVDNEKITQLAK